MSCQLTKVKFISMVLVTLMLWHFGALRVYVQARSIQNQQEAEAARHAPLKAPKNRFDALLGELKDVVKRGGAKTKAARENGFAGIEKLTELRGKLIAENEKIQKQFDQLESSLKQKGLPSEILNRHAQSVREYEAKYAVLMARVEGIESAQNQTVGWWAKLTGRNKEVNWDGVLGETSKFLEENTPRPAESSLDPKNLPHRSLKADQAIPPKLTREQWLTAFPKDSVSSASVPPSTTNANASSALFATTPPTPADLAETVEVKFTQDLQDLANSLDKNPVKIFNWVRNNIEFVPTWGSIQGAQLCFENRAGNAFDTASLLIALLRASAIPARYQMGTIEVPVDQFRNWAGGFTDTDAAASLFASAGVPSVVRRVNQSGQVVTVKLEHIWVKAFIDYTPSGGAINIEGDTWIDLDPSFKQYDFPSSVNLSQFVRLTNAQTFLNQTLAPATVNQSTGEVTNMDLALIQSTLQPDETAIFNYLSTNFPQKSMREIIGDKSIAVRESRILAARLPYKVVASGVGFADLPAALRHTLELSVSDAAGNQLMSFAQSLPALSGFRVTLGYVPGTETDRQAIAGLIPSDPQQPLPNTIPTSFINMRPELRIDNQVVSTGSVARLGTAQSLQIKFNSPTIQTPSIQNSITVGGNFAIALDLQQVSPGTLSGISERFRQIAAEANAHPASPNISPAEIKRLLLNSIISGWFRQVDLLNRLTARMFGVVSLRYPSAGIAFSDLQTGTLFGAVHQVTFGGISMDIDRDVVVTLARDGSPASVTHHSVVMGMLGSGLEASVPAQFLHRVGETNEFWISTTSSLAAAQSLGGTTVALNSNNFPLVAPRLRGLTPEDQSDIEDALNAGMTIMLHEQPLGDRTSRFQGYSRLDPRDGSGAYIIGQANGAERLSCLDVDLRPTTLGQNLAVGEMFDVGGQIVAHYVEGWGGPGGLAGAILDLVSIVNSLSQNAMIYDQAVSRLGPSVRPLMGLVILMTALDLLKSVLGAAGALAGPTGVVVGAYLNLVSWTAFNMAALLINRLIETEAAAAGLQFKSGCLQTL